MTILMALLPTSARTPLDALPFFCALSLPRQTPCHGNCFPAQCSSHLAANIKQFSIRLQSTSARAHHQHLIRLAAPSDHNPHQLLLVARLVSRNHLNHVTSTFCSSCRRRHQAVHGHLACWANPARGRTTCAISTARVEPFNKPSSIHPSTNALFLLMLSPQTPSV